MADFIIEIPMLQEIDKKLESLLSKYDSIDSKYLGARIANIESRLEMAEVEILLDNFKDKQDFKREQIGFAQFAHLINSLHDRVCLLEANAAQSVKSDVRETETKPASTEKSQQRTPPSKN